MVFTALPLRKKGLQAFNLQIQGPGISINRTIFVVVTKPHEKISNETCKFAVIKM